MKNVPVLMAVLLAILTYSLPGKTIIVPKEVSSIQAALDKSQPGDTVFVLKGIYRECIVLTDKISLIGESTTETVIQGNGRRPVVKTADKALLKNFIIENGGTGIRCENTNATIVNCIIRDNKETGIHSLITLPDIRNCIIYRNKWTGLFCESARSIKTIVEHNVFAENSYSGIMLSGKSEVLIQNNVFFNNKEYGIWVGEESNKSRIIYNDFFGNRTSNNYYAQVDRSNISENPMYPQIENDYDFFRTNSIVLKGKGKDGVTIGLISEAVLKSKKDDPDGDSVSGEKDHCPSMAEDMDGFEDEDGCPDFDNDKDGIYDTQDQCPDKAEDFDDFRDDDGCPDNDNDKDGIPDESDTCPNEKETVNGYKDEDGCPDALVKDEK